MAKPKGSVRGASLVFISFHEESVAFLLGFFPFCFPASIQYTDDLCETCAETKC